MRVRVSPSAVSGRVAAPPSKSYTHRAVILGSLARGETIVESPLLSDDTRYTIDACRALGVNIRVGDNLLKIDGGSGKFPARPEPQTVFVGNSGSTLRLMGAVAALAPASIILDGEPRLRERPVGDLVAALRALGASVAYKGREGYPPIEVRGGRLEGGEVAVSGLVGSQHVSALLMVAPYAEKPVEIRITDSLRSRPYVDMTIDAMRSFGVEVDNHDYHEFMVANGKGYIGGRYRVEGDYSSAAYFFAAAAITRGTVGVEGLNPASAQGDRRLLDILWEMGCRVEYGDGVVEVAGDELKGVTADMGDYPDIVQPLAVVAACAQGRTKLANIGHLRYKESDRISATAAELAKMGIKTDVADDALIVSGGKPRGALIDAHSDHRIAMSFAVAALSAVGDTVIDGAESVAKSYPEFFADLARIGAKIEVIG